ncbi:MAG: hypothetical protein R3F17_02605 [Planctomycetota bacterium]
MMRLETLARTAPRSELEAQPMVDLWLMGVLLKPEEEHPGPPGFEGGVLSMVLLTQGEARVEWPAGGASAEIHTSISQDGRTEPVVFDLHREGSAWKVDLLSMYRHMEPTLREAAEIYMQLSPEADTAEEVWLQMLLEAREASPAPVFSSGGKFGARTRK